jgi:hypothetical protein
MSNNNLSDFTSYIESLCEKHVDILHGDDKHFVDLSDEKQLNDQKTLCYPLVTMEKLTVSYEGAEDFMTKNRYIEMMFLDSVSDAFDFVSIQEAKVLMETIAEDFIKKIKADKKKRNLYPFLKNLTLSDINLDYVEISARNVYGVLLSFFYELGFDETLDTSKFSSES